MYGLLGIGAQTDERARYYAQAAFKGHNVGTPVETLNLKKAGALKKLEDAKKEIEAIDEAIDLLEQNPKTTKILNALSKLGI